MNIQSFHDQLMAAEAPGPLLAALRRVRSHRHTPQGPLAANAEWDPWSRELNAMADWDPWSPQLNAMAQWDPWTAGVDMTSATP